MKYNPKPIHRKSIRLKNYDYSQRGLYFVTTCVQNRKYLFGEIVDTVMSLNDAGQMIQSQWQALPQRFQQINLKEFIVMPNHFHGIIEIAIGTPLVVARSTDSQEVSPTVGDIVGAFKSISTHKYISGVKTKNWQRFDKRLWQRNYWEHIVRNESEYHLIAEYIDNNSIMWNKDKLNNDLGNCVTESSGDYQLETWMI